MRFIIIINFELKIFKNLEKHYLVEYFLLK